MKMMKLVVNGDDLGYTMANTYGIFQAYKEGILRSTTVLTNSVYFEKAMDIAAEKYPDLGIGVHMTLTLGKPLTENRTLSDPATGCFYRGSETIWKMNPDYDEIYREWKAQIDRYISFTGHLPTHLDSHHHVHLANPKAEETAMRLAGEYGLQLRGRGSFEFVRGFYGGFSTKETLMRILEDHLGRDIELMVHPGWCDLELYRMSSYNVQRVKELDILCDPQIRRWIEEHNIELCHY